MVRKTSFKTSRRSFIGNYILGIGLFICLILFNIILTLPLILIYFFISLILILLIQPECVILYRSYQIREDIILEIKGIVAKKRTAIPLKSIAHTVMNKGIVGRLLNFGDLIITGVSRDRIIFRGIKNPDKVLKRIEKILERKK